MGEKTNISWCDHTFNIVWGCAKVSEGCRFCYAEGTADRWGFDVWGPDKPRREFGDAHWNEPLTWQKKAKAVGRRDKVFCASMGDVFEAHPTVVASLPRLWALIRATPDLDWQLLTKRPERILDSLPPDWGNGWSNVWLGTSVENQEAADKRIPILAQVPAAIRFLSVEPLIGPVQLEHMLYVDGPKQELAIDWIIVGGESGPDHRPMEQDWARSVRDQCQRNGVAYFFKQFGGKWPGGNRLLDGQEWSQFPESPATLPHNSR